MSSKGFLCLATCWQVALSLVVALSMACWLNTWSCLNVMTINPLLWRSTDFSLTACEAKSYLWATLMQIFSIKLKIQGSINYQVKGSFCFKLSLKQWDNVTHLQRELVLVDQPGVPESNETCSLPQEPFHVLSLREDPNFTSAQECRRGGFTGWFISISGDAYMRLITMGGLL